MRFARDLEAYVIDAEKKERLTAALQALFREAAEDAEVMSWSLSSMPMPNAYTVVTIEVHVTGGQFTPPPKPIVFRVPAGKGAKG